MINILLINRHSYCFLSMSVLDGAHEYFEYNNDQDDNFIMMMMMILAVIMIFKCLLLAIDFATCYSTRYSDFSSQPYSNPTRSQKKPYSLGPAHNPSLILHLSLSPLTHCHTCYSCNSTKRTQFKPLFHSASQSDSYNSRQLAYGVVGHFHTMQPTKFFFDGLLFQVIII